MRHDEYFDIDPFVVYCHITTWLGTSIGAQHYYGKIVFEPNGIREELSYKLDRSAAVAHNKGLRRLGRPSREYVKAGEWTTGFPDEDKVRETAIAYFHEGKMRDRWDEKNLSLTGAIFLIEGDHRVAQPQEILACAPGFEGEMSRLNKLFTEGNGWDWDCDSTKRLDALSAQWYSILKDVKGRAGK